MKGLDAQLTKLWHDLTHRPDVPSPPARHHQHRHEATKRPKAHVKHERRLQGKAARKARQRNRQ